MNKQKKLLVLAAAVLGLSLAAGAAASTRSTKSTTLNLVAYSTPKPVLTRLISAFQATPQGSGVNIQASYGGSSAQAAAVVAGQPADVVILSTGTDMNLLQDHGLVSPKWNRQSYDGVVWNSVVVYGLRNGNPKHIKSWADLVKPGVGVLIPNPFTAGIAKWDILTPYVAERRLGKTDKQARQFVKTLFDHVVSQDSSGSNATNTFLSGKGDALITFESEAINGKIPYVIPRQTMLIDIYGAVTTKSEHPAEASAFLRYVKSPAGQTILGQNGYRPVNRQVFKQFAKSFPVRPGQTTIDDRLLGGWRAVDTKWFAARNSIMATIEKNLGVSTSG
ncbi:MAG TPA: sulfate ABC transporter substrate-binding protein [Gaiellaceae bacterium]|nr:sulfate ABC transporter substrate-binding protein [Gaiellaceae bacterium]